LKRPSSPLLPLSSHSIHHSDSQAQSSQDGAKS
jgi:hypothetical protein